MHNIFAESSNSAMRYQNCINIPFMITYNVKIGFYDKPNQLNSSNMEKNNHKNLNLRSNSSRAVNSPLSLIQ